MSRLFTIQSGSSGNCAYVGGEKSGVLVDAGAGIRLILRTLQERDIDRSAVRGIVITHEHSDHVKNLPVILKHLQVPVISTAPTLERMARDGVLPPGCDCMTIEDSMAFADMDIRRFATPHDAVDASGFVFTLSDDRVIGVATDLGHVTDEVRDALSGCDAVLIEANYEQAMLDCSRYPYFLKMRIKGDTGHLSNAACADLMPHLLEQGVTRFVLVHLSLENNMPSIAYHAALGGLSQGGGVLDRDFLLSVAPRLTPSHTLVL